MLLLLALRNFKRSKIRTTVIILSIATIIFLYSTIDIAVDIMSETMVKTYLGYVGDFDILIYKNKSPFLFDITNTSSTIESVNNINVSAYRLYIDSTIIIDNNTYNLIVLGIFPNETIGSFELTYGSLNLTGYNCIITQEVANFLGVSIGDNLTVENLYNATYQVVGIVKQIGKLPITMNHVIFVNIRSLWEILNTTDVANTIFVKVNPEIYRKQPDKAVNDILKIAEELQEKLGFDFTIVPYSAYVLDGVSNAISIEKTLLKLFASISILMATLLIALTSTMNLEDRIREIGLLRAIGLSNFHITMLYLTEHLLYSLFGVAIGIIASAVIGKLLFSIKISLLSIMSIVDNEFEIIVISFAISLIIGLYPSISTNKMNISEAMRPMIRRVFDIKSLERKISISRPIYSALLFSVPIILLFSAATILLPKVFVSTDINFILTVLFVSVLLVIVAFILFFISVLPTILIGLSKFFRSIKLNSPALSLLTMVHKKRRVIIATAMIAMSLSAIYFVGILISTQHASSIKSIKLDSGADIVVYPRENLYTNFTKELQNISTVQHACAVIGGMWARAGDMILWRSKWVKVFGINPSDYINASYAREFIDDLSAFNELKKNMTVIISSGLSSALSIGEGDKLRLDIYGKSVVLYVVGVFDEMPGFKFTRFSSRSYSTDVIVSILTLINILNFEPTASKFLVSSNSPEETAREIIKNLGRKYNIQVVTTQEYISRTEKDLSTLLFILTALLDFSLGIGVFGLVIFIVSSTRERKWEIALLRSLGLSRLQLLGILLTEHLTIPILSFIFAIITSIAVNMEVNYMISILNDISINIVIPNNLIFTTFLMVLIPSLIVSTLMIFPLLKSQIASVLRESEL